MSTPGSRVPHRVTLLGLLSCALACGEGLDSLGTSSAAVTQPSVVSLTLINADTDQPISQFDPIENGATIDLLQLPTKNLNLRANTSPSTVGSVRFGFDSRSSYRVENVAPYALAGDSNGNYYAWTPSLGAHVVTATPYSSSSGGGTAGTTFSRTFEVVSGAAPTAPSDGGAGATDAGTSAPDAGTIADGGTPTDGGSATDAGDDEVGGVDAGVQPVSPGLSGELKVWHPITLTIQGPAASETGTPNPFLDYRMNVTFSQGTRSFTVPGYFAADGNAAESSAASGSAWRVHFVPDTQGSWTYHVSFRSGAGIAVSTDPAAGTPLSGVDGLTGSFSVGSSDKTGRDHRAHGLLRHIGGHHLQFAGSKQYFLKGGADSPENFLAFHEFDQTPAKHVYQPHAGDFRPGDPTWQGGKGRNIIGALNYLAAKGMNSVYFLTMNVGGDGKDVWPWTSSSERYRFDVSKLAQWEVVFSHMDRLGLMLHVVTQETENDQLLDGGALGVQRKLYYRELVARFGHHLALVWNLGEENTNTTTERKAFAQHLKAIDPYDHPVVLHTYPGQYDAVYDPLLGDAHFDGPSLQLGSMGGVHSETIKWLNDSAAAGRKWVVTLDEIGPASTGVVPDAVDPSHDAVRKQALWGNLMAGGGGVEWYFGYSYAHHDLTCEDWRSRDAMWDQTRIALEFFQQHLPFHRMRHADALTSATNDYVFASPGEVYAVYLPTGGTTQLDLGSCTGTFSVRWYNPRTGGALQTGSTASITGPGQVSLGQPPSEGSQDWAALVRFTGTGTCGGASTGGGSDPTSADTEVAGFTLINADTDQPIVGFDPVPEGAVIDLSTLPTVNLTLRANTQPAVVGSVRFGLDGNPNHRVESAAPYALFGDTNGHYNAWNLGSGVHTVTGTPYSGGQASGTAGVAKTLQFTLK